MAVVVVGCCVSSVVVVMFSAVCCVVHQPSLSMGGMAVDIILCTGGCGWIGALCAMKEVNMAYVVSNPPSKNRAPLKHYEYQW